jgi:hypothetical protein
MDEAWVAIEQARTMPASISALTTKPTKAERNDHRQIHGLTSPTTILLLIKLVGSKGDEQKVAALLSVSSLTAT